MPYFFLGIVRGHIVRSTYFDDGLYDGLELTTIGWQRSIKIAIDSQGSKFFYYFEEQKTFCDAGKYSVTWILFFH